MLRRALVPLAPLRSLMPVCRVSRSMYQRTASVPSLARTQTLRHSASAQRRHASVKAPKAKGEVTDAHVAKAEVERILAALTVGQATLAEISAKDVFNPTLGNDGVLWLDLGEKGHYSLQAQPNGQLLLFSPITGPLYYAHDPVNKWWANPNDGHLMVELLVRELMHVTSVYIDL